jgi:predicted transposase/invertase (TIGR01784 family)
LLIDFLNELIHEKGKITEVKYLNAEQLGRSEYDRKAVYDIYCESNTGEKFIVEMQKSKHDFFKDRSVFYSTFPIREQAIKGEWDYQLTAVYTIGILDFKFNKNKADKDYYHSEVKLMDTKKKTVFYDKLTFIYLEMPKFKKTVNQLETHFDKWMYVLKNLSKLQELPLKLQEKIFKKVCDIAEISKMNKAEIAEYENSLKVYRDWYSTITTARNEGEKKGIKKGRKEGREEGKKEGREEGKIEEKIETALQMLSDKMPIDAVSKYTRLPIEQIKELILMVND